MHQIRVSTRYVSYKDIKQVMADPKKIYTSVTLDEAEEQLLAFGERWRSQYPSCVKSWEDNWVVLSTFFEYPLEIRKIVSVKYFHACTLLTWYANFLGLQKV